jgi:hypothetical protein
LPIERIGQGHIEALKVGGRSPRYRPLADEADEDPLVWQYTLRQVRDLSAQALPAAPARRQAGFDLDQSIAAGKADFGQGKPQVSLPNNA